MLFNQSEIEFNCLFKRRVEKVSPDENDFQASESKIEKMIICSDFQQEKITQAKIFLPRFES